MNIAFLPVRCGSKSIKLKNIKLFCGKPLVYWNLIELENASEIDKVVVATDCKEIIKCVEGFKFSKVEIYNRDEENANDIASTESVMLEYIIKNNFDNEDFFLLVQATSPFTQERHFSEAIKLLSESNSDSLLTCVRSKRFFWDKNISVNYDYRNRPRRQDFEGLLMENGAFYINSIKNILKDKNRLSGKIYTYEMEEYTGIEIDEEDDWVLAEHFMKKYIFKKKPISQFKIIISDVDGVLTDGSMYYTEKGDEIKRFSTYDGMAFSLFKKKGLKTGIITSEETKLVKNRAEKMKLDFCKQGKYGIGKLEACKDICKQLDITLNDVIYIGDDINCIELLKEVGLAACPSNAIDMVKNIENITILKSKGGTGVLRELYNILF